MPSPAGIRHTSSHIDRSGTVLTPRRPTMQPYRTAGTRPGCSADSTAHRDQHQLDGPATPRASTISLTAWRSASL
jgi:hypothetical protein